MGAGGLEQKMKVQGRAAAMGSVSVAGENDIGEVFADDEVGDFGRVVEQAQVATRQMSTLAVAGERGRVGLVAGSFQEVLDRAPCAPRPRPIRRLAIRCDSLRSLPTRLRYWRERRGLTQMQLAQLSAVGVATVRRIEAGHDTYLGTIEKLAKALRIKPWHLIDWSASITDRGRGGRSERS